VDASALGGTLAEPYAVKTVALLDSQHERHAS
jgi:hypothetical protein